MASGYALYKGSHVLSVRHSYLLEHVKKTLEEVINEIKCVASHFDCVVITDKNRIIIHGNDDIGVLNVLLSFMEMQLLITT